MKKFLIITLLGTFLFSTEGTVAQNTYGTATGYASFFSEAPVRNIDAQNKKVQAEFNTSTGEMSFVIQMKDFQFASGKMQKDAKAKYLETDKYPEATFKGILINIIDYTRNGVYPATASGKLKIHGVEKNVTEKGTVTVKNGEIILQSEFTILLKDYNIETPKIAFKKMAKDNVLVKIAATLTRQAKNVTSEKK